MVYGIVLACVKRWSKMCGMKWHLCVVVCVCVQIRIHMSIADGVCVCVRRVWRIGVREECAK